MAYAQHQRLLGALKYDAAGRDRQGCKLPRQQAGREEGLLVVLKPLLPGCTTHFHTHSPLLSRLRPPGRFCMLPFALAPDWHCCRVAKVTLMKRLTFSSTRSFIRVLKYLLSMSGGRLGKAGKLGKRGNCSSKACCVGC